MGVGNIDISGAAEALKGLHKTRGGKIRGVVDGSRWEVGVRAS